MALPETVTLRLLSAAAALSAAGVCWPLLRPLLLHLFSAGRDWLVAQPLAGCFLLALVYGALLACLLLLFALFPDEQLADAGASVPGLLLVVLPVLLAPVLGMLVSRQALPSTPDAGALMLVTGLVLLAAFAHWYRVRVARRQA